MDAQTPLDVTGTQAEPRSAFVQPTDDVLGNSSGPLAASAMQAHLVQQWQRGHRSPFAVILLRSWNHAERGQSEHAAALLAELRPQARVGVYDRRTLIVVAPATRTDAAMGLARTLSVRLSGRGRIACGVAIHPDTAGSPAQLLAAAERAARRASSAELVVVAPAQPYVSEPRAGYVPPGAGVLAAALSGFHAEFQAAHAVLVRGEPGSGKLSLARWLHQQGAQRSAPFKVIHCAAIPEDAQANVLFAERTGAFAQADGGCLCLEDVSSLAPAVQASLARVLELGRLSTAQPGAASLNVQCIATSHADLDQLAEQGGFDRGLLAQLRATTFEVPPLRSRREEVVALAEYFIQSISAQWGTAAPRLADASRSVLEAYAWPGNLDELRHVLERAVALTEDDVITPCEFPEHMAPAPTCNAEPERVAPAIRGGFLDLRASLIDHEAMLIRQALQLSRGNQRKAAGLLKLPLRTLERKLRSLGGRSRLMAS